MARRTPNGRRGGGSGGRRCSRRHSRLAECSCRPALRTPRTMPTRIRRTSAARPAWAGIARDPPRRPRSPEQGGSVDVYLTVRPSVKQEADEPDDDELRAFNKLTIGKPAGPDGLTYTAATFTGGGSGRPSPPRTVTSDRSERSPSRQRGLPLHGQADPERPTVRHRLVRLVGRRSCRPRRFRRFFSRAATGNSLTANPAGCHLSMEKQPTDTVKNQHISDALYSAAGPCRSGSATTGTHQLVTTLDGQCPSGSGPACVTSTTSRAETRPPISAAPSRSR